MKKEDVQDIIYCLGNDRRKFYFYKDRFYIDELIYMMDKNHLEKIKIQDIKNTSKGRFLNKPLLKKLMANTGSGEISRSLLELCLAKEALTIFTL